VRLPRLWWLPIGPVPEISPQELQGWLEEGRPLQLVDSRTGPEYQQGTISAARHAPVTAMPASIQRLPIDPDRPVVMLCLSGHRSRPGTRWLRAQGIEAYSLKGGILAWRQAGYPLNEPSINNVNGLEQAD
jgi:rhodanese-related sulfurtransferase